MEELTGRSKHRRGKKVKRTEGGVNCKTECEQCDKVYIGKTKFYLDKRMEQYKNKTNNAIAKHVMETQLDIN